MTYLLDIFLLMCSALLIANGIAYAAIRSRGDDPKLMMALSSLCFFVAFSFLLLVEGP